MTRLLIIACLTCLPHSVLPAQRADMAAEARRLSSVSLALLAAGDTAGAADSMSLAATTWQMQGAYALAAARLNAFAGRVDETLSSLNRTTTMGMSWLAEHPAFSAIAENPRFQELASRSAGNRDPFIRSRVAHRLKDTGFHPEGVAHDPRTGRVFVSSVRRRKVVAIEADGRVIDFVATDAGLDAVFGIAVDTARGLLWLATGHTAEQEGEPATAPGMSEVVAVDLASGELKRRWAAPGDSTHHLIGDVFVAPDGRVYATDSRAAIVYRVPVGGSRPMLEPAPFHHRDWTSPQGMAFSPDGRTAWLADWTVGLYRIDLVENVVEPVGAPADVFVLGIDGLNLLPDGRLAAIQNGIAPPRVVALALDGEGRNVTALETLDRHLPEAIEPTLGVLLDGGLLYVANSTWSLYPAGNTATVDSGWPEPVLLYLPVEMRRPPQ